MATQVTEAAIAALGNLKASESVSVVEIQPDEDSEKSHDVSTVNTASVQTRPQLPIHNSASKRTLAPFSLQGKVCVVTGGASGIGLSICQAILESGGEVALVDLNAAAAEEKSKFLVDSYVQGNSQATVPLVSFHVADVSSSTSVDEAIESVLAKHGRIDCLVTSAGICENIPAVSYPPSRLQKMWSINIDGSFYFATAVARHLIARKNPGSIVFIGSMSGSVVNVPQVQAPYNMSKAAVRQMAKSLAVEWATHGIRVNCISPGYIMTALTEKIVKSDPELYAEWVSRTPVGRLGKPADIAGPVVFLLSDLSTYMTGSEMIIDGGYTCV